MIIDLTSSELSVTIVAVYASFKKFYDTCMITRISYKSYMTLYDYRGSYMTLYDYRDFCMMSNRGFLCPCTFSFFRISSLKILFQKQDNISSINLASSCQISEKNAVFYILFVNTIGVSLKNLFIKFGRSIRTGEAKV